MTFPKEKGSGARLYIRIHRNTSRSTNLLKSECRAIPTLFPAGKTVIMEIGMQAIGAI